MTGIPVEPLRLERRKLFEQVAHHLEEQIVSGRLAPGDRLPAERDLMQLFGVGRPAIREALIALRKAGLIEITNGMPARVATPTAAGMLSGLMPSVRQMLRSEPGQRHFQNVRLFFEVGLAREAARTATPAQVEHLAAALAANEAAIGDREAFVDTDVAFHFVLAEITGNPVFIALHDAMAAWLREQRTVAVTAPGQERRGYEAHRAIWEAIAAHDADAAEAAMRRHLEQVAVAYWRSLEVPA